MNNHKLARVAEIQYGLLMSKIQQLIASGKKPGFNYSPQDHYKSISYNVQLRFKQVKP
jgi:hypothetical protein